MGSQNTNVHNLLKIYKMLVKITKPEKLEISKKLENGGT